MLSKRHGIEIPHAPRGRKSHILAEAQRRGISRRELVNRLISTIERDKIVGAILDD